MMKMGFEKASVLASCTEAEARIKRLVDDLLERRQPTVIFAEIDERRQSHKRILKNMEFVESVSS